MLDDLGQWLLANQGRHAVPSQQHEHDGNKIISFYLQNIFKFNVTPVAKEASGGPPLYQGVSHSSEGFQHKYTNK